MSDLSLTLLCPPGMEENLLDFLLMSPHASIFTSAPTAAHGLAFGRLSATEQVLGRTSAVQVQAIIPEADRAHLIEHLRQQFAGAGLRYWLLPVIEAGEIA
jgi:hypothetical protein